MRPATVPEDLLRSIIAYLSPRQVILFGSQARGDAGSDSDIDLVVVLDDDVPADRLLPSRPDRGLATVYSFAGG